jgi:hypothetical protein
MSFKNREFKKFPTERDILGLITDLDIFSYYLGAIPKKLICSPLRDDLIPSFGLFKSDKYGMTLYKDFANGESGNCFVFVKKLFNLDKVTDAYTRIASDFFMTQFETNTPIPSGKLKSYVAKSNIGNLQKERIEIKVKVRAWSNEDREYWFLKYGINISLLRECQVYPISHYFLNSYCVKVTGIAYAFVENKDGAQTYKIYQPFGENKWINNNNYSVWELWTQMPATGKNLIITSSRKDAMVIKSLFDPKEVTSNSLQGENFKPKMIVMEELAARFDNVLILYDNDKAKKENWGKIAAAKICKEYDELGIKQIEIPDIYEEKDISDYREVHGKEKSLRLLTHLIHAN